MIGWLTQTFGIPNGDVWPNVYAMVPCGIVAWLWGRRTLLKHHREHMAKLEQIHAHLLGNTK